jgi:predicted nucleotidyltransferase
MATLHTNSTFFSPNSKPGPWPKPVLARLRQALVVLTTQAQVLDGVVGVVLFGSYARGEFGRKSDVDVLVLVQPGEVLPTVRSVVVRIALEAETTHRLPMHIALLVAAAQTPDELGDDLLHALWSDGIILYAQAAALARLQPTGLAPWVVLRFSAAGLSPSRRVQLSRLVHGRARGQLGKVQPPGLLLGRGAALVPPEQAAALRTLFDELGVVYDAVPVWRPTT